MKFKLNLKRTSQPIKAPDRAPFESIKTEPEFPCANENDSRVFDCVQLGNGAVCVEVMIYAKGEKGLRPLLILNSIDFPMPPSVSFCEKMRANGLKVIFIRRPGFGGSPGLPQVLLSEPNIRNGAAVIAEASIIAKTISTLSLRGAILLGIGSANPVCYRLSLICPEVDRSIFSNPVFNQNSWEGFRPAWFRAIVRQTVFTKTGFRIAAKSLKFYLKKNSLSFFSQLLSRSPADHQYLDANSADFLAASRLMRSIEPETYFYEMSMSLWTDKFLKDGLFSNTNGVVLSGSETTPQWLQRTKEESFRLGIPRIVAPAGRAFVAYVNPDVLLDIISEKANLG